MVNVILAGGGTAGHTSPLIATAQAITAIAPDTQITCIGTARGLETRVVPEAGLDLELVPAVPLPRKINLDLFRVPGRLAGAVRQAKKILRAHDADVVCGFGGYASLPAYLAARRLKIPVVIHEQNALPGLANKIASRFAVAVLTSFPGTELKGARFEGLPVRRAITDLAEAGRTAAAASARQSFGLAPDLPVLLVSGGSQGARSLNDATVDAADRLLAAGIQVLHVWGPKNYHDGLTERVDQTTGARYVPVGYVDAMERAYAAADLMLARSGAGTVVEVATVGLPAIMVPLPIGNGEQARNAKPLVDASAAICIDDAELTADRLVSEVTALFAAPGKLAAMSAAAQKLMRPDAAARVAHVVLDAAQAGER
ncbi:undecaprenyldiphospho-muramoylpentapeptide beta-N-acetylglucosaminyltransferase [Brooklawnia propionicigenes]|jgi:UDP-N-acetylglucosamine--N-acetylmuramyl-(pentapeptide) pyrophosphoryl-undecaprenol N-acetylglucosamine transferase|uniref:UDP-N-acetylglucosamine--N-acetylmuramyl-(pentapeptide) pyrophosphoryl-undecaprenol N-acetylglucosamine transferase n=1 Tax=Brooklawnia propionicigenes TaxID=3041175 RepID=A0AAN0KGN4_9ACTN|nr:undecaprenyldiphospho-muramoylpentapeptide beta-N-acetylglucosaminyltransferase [Brooklawnia sp. SH051]BEH01230.1 undecaprenyldiphospho-muramoylpentapeptide beta-N-acetylglucosaminyltransferase [Brooklawnia sp. SH051]